jgi:hypothetical protein
MRHVPHVDIGIIRFERLVKIIRAFAISHKEEVAPRGLNVGSICSPTGISI